MYHFGWPTAEGMVILILAPLKILPFPTEVRAVICSGVFFRSNSILYGTGNGPKSQILVIPGLQHIRLTRLYITITGFSARVHPSPPEWVLRLTFMHTNGIKMEPLFR